MIQDFLCKTIHIENYDRIIKELTVYAYDNEPKNVGASNPYYHLKLPDLLAKCPSINAWFKGKKIIPRVCAIIVIVGNGHDLTHVDHQKQTLALNFGIKIPEGSYTGLYNLINGQMYEAIQPNGIPKYNFSNDAKFQLIDQFDLLQPTIFNTKIPHGVYSPIGEKRISLSFRFIEDPWSLLNDNN
jgi:hypothetical protein